MFTRPQKRRDTATSRKHRPRTEIEKMSKTAGRFVPLLLDLVLLMLHASSSSSGLASPGGRCKDGKPRGEAPEVDEVMVGGGVVNQQH